MSSYARVRRFPRLPAPKVYLVGDSQLSAHLQGQGGWRAMAYRALVDSGYNPDFRGSIVNTTDTPPLSSTAIAGISHSGLDGASGVNWYLSYWDSFNFPTSFPTPADYPQIVLIAVGTNDANTQAASTSFCRLIDKAFAAIPTAAVLFATPPKTSTGGFTVQAPQTRLEVAARQAAGQNVRLVDQDAVNLVNGDWLDGLHLSTSGCRKVADQCWIPALLTTLEA